MKIGDTCKYGDRTVIVSFIDIDGSMMVNDKETGHTTAWVWPKDLVPV
jgi:hypothetical protein